MTDIQFNFFYLPNSACHRPRNLEWIGRWVHDELQLASLSFLFHSNSCYILWSQSHRGRILLISLNLWHWFPLMPNTIASTLVLVWASQRFSSRNFHLNFPSVSCYKSPHSPGVLPFFPSIGVPSIFQSVKLDS